MDNINNKNKKNEIENMYGNVLFVADLPKETTNDDLSKIFKDYHFLFASLNNLKNNTTCAQVYLESTEWATKARHELNGYVLIPTNCINAGKPIRICKYEGKGANFNRHTNIKQSLLVKNIDINMSQKEFYKIFLEFGDVSSGKIEYDENGISKGYGYIYYYDEESAENAKKSLNGKLFYGKPLNICNLIPQKRNKSNLITLFVLNIPNNVKESELKPIFEKFGTVVNVNITNKGFAYVSYSNLESASKCLSELKHNPISFPGCSNVVVKFASTKEERESNRNYLSNNNKNEEMKNANLNVQFTLYFPTSEIKTDLDLDKEIRLFIKVIMLMEYVPKEVLVDLETMSGLVTFGKISDYELFFSKYYDFCSKYQPSFECVPYENTPNDQEETMGTSSPYNQNEDFNNNKMQNENNMYNNNQNFDQRMNNDNFNRNFQNNPMNNVNNMSNMINNMNMQMNNNLYNNLRQQQMQGNNYMNNMSNMNNMNNNQMNNRNKFMQQQMNNNKNNFVENNNMNMNNLQRQPGLNPNYIVPQIYGNSNNININMNPNFIPINQFSPQQNLMMLQQQQQQKLNQQQMNYNNFILQQLKANPNMINKNNMMNNNNDINNNMRNNFRNNNNLDNRKQELDLIDQRNLQNLNPLQLQSQFNKPPINVCVPNMLDSKEQEELTNEIADSIYEIVYGKYPNDASKITGMIKEMGIEKMNMLLSKQEDLNDIIDRAHELIYSKNGIQ